LALAQELALYQHPRGGQALLLAKYWSRNHRRGIWMATPA